METIPEPDFGGAAWRVAAGACGAALVLALIVARSPNFDMPSGPDARPYGGDFVQEYAAGSILRSGDRTRLYEVGYLRGVEHDPEIVGFEWSPALWFPPVYPPWYYVAVSPLAALDFRIAVAVWLGALVLCAAASAAWLLARFAFWRTHAVWALPAAFLFFPLTESLVSLQKGTVLLGLFTATFALLERRRSFAAGAVFGLVAFKPQLGLALAGVAVLERDARFVAGAAATVLALLAVSLAADPVLLVDWARATWGVIPQMEPDLLRRSHTWLGQARLLVGEWSGLAVLALWAAFATATVVALVVLVRATPDPRELPLRFSGVVLATVLLSPHLYSYDLTLLLLPFALLIASAPEPERRARVRWVLALFLLGGLSPRIAAVVPLQLSTWAMFGLLVFLARAAPTARARVAPADRDHASAAAIRDPTSSEPSTKTGLKRSLGR